MCGITGFYNVHNPELLMKMAERIKHRGPDAAAFIQLDHVGLAHQRLSIIDLSESGNQPMFDSSKRYSIVYNGEVYNYLELKKILISKGIVFKSTSDTEVVMHYFIEFGIKGLSDLNGMFAFAIYDSVENKLVLCRDRFGIKPLYYLQFNDSLYFSSEIKSFFEIPELKFHLNQTAIKYYLRFQYIPSPLTIFDEVKKLPPGHALTVRAGKFELDKYWQLKTSEEINPDEKTAISHVKNLVEKSVEKHLISDVPVGVFLSGGLDSSVIAAIANKKVRGLNTFSIVFENSPKEDESAFSRKVSRLLQTNHHEFAVSPEMGEDVFEDVVYQMDEPMGDPALLPTYLLSRETSKHIKVVLNGEGADEIFAGYKQYFIDDYLKNKAVQLGMSVFSKMNRSNSSYNFQRLTRAAISNSDFNRRQEYAAIFSNSDLDELFIDNSTGNKIFLDMKNTDDSKSDLNSWLRDDMKYWLPDDLLMKADKMMMRFSLEGRVPFLENDLFDYANSLPKSFKLKGKEGKWILRKVATSYLPHDIVYRKKHGFNVPVGKWFRTTLSGFAEENFRSLKIMQTLNVDRAHQILTDHINGVADYSRQIYVLLNLAIWLRQNEHRITQ